MKSEKLVVPEFKDNNETESLLSSLGGSASNERAKEIADAGFELFKDLCDNNKNVSILGFIERLVKETAKDQAEVWFCLYVAGGVVRDHVLVSELKEAMQKHASCSCQKEPDGQPKAVVPGRGIH